VEGGKRNIATTTNGAEIKGRQVDQTPGPNFTVLGTAGAVGLPRQSQESSNLDPSAKQQAHLLSTRTLHETHKELIDTPSHSQQPIINVCKSNLSSYLFCFVWQRCHSSWHLSNVYWIFT
jgi:hypothetical protein